MNIMKALLLYGVPQDDPTGEKVNRAIHSNLEMLNFEIQSVILSETQIAPCLGCFGCWVKTPGVCIIDDAGRDIARAYMQSDMVVFVSPVTFGGYSYELKKAFDRLIPNLSPYFRRVSGEIHHKMRYKRYPSALIIGVLSEPDQEKEDIFKRLAKRNSLNYEHPAWAVGVFHQNQTEDEIRTEIKSLVLETAGDFRQKVGGTR